MEGSDGSPPQSLCMIRAAELFPKPQMEKEDTQLGVPFQELAGESIKFWENTDDGVLALSNYRIFLLKSSTNSETSVPLGLIESAQCRDLFHLYIYCKDASTVKCSFETAEQCAESQRRIQLSVGVPETLEALFAFPFYSWTCDEKTLCPAAAATYQGTAGIGSASANGDAFVNGNGEQQMLSALFASEHSERMQRATPYENDFMREVERLGFDYHGPWRISKANEDFKLCPSYPQKILVPCCISDDTLQVVANFRGSRRLPVVVWRHKSSGAVIARCSQPEVGWLGWREAKDEQLLKAIADACAFDRGELSRKLQRQAPNFYSSSGSANLTATESSAPSSPDSSHEEVAMDEVRKVLIVDARSYTSAVTNRARGGGCECIEYYPCAEIEFMNLGNIHAIRKSFHALRQLCASPPDVLNWLSMLEKTMWLQHLSGLMASAVTVCHAIENKGRPVLVHCSDGWDRTPQIVATAELCLDPYYRTVEGFRVLVEREWLSFGHKFADRCGHGPGSEEVNERCPVFLQWLDLVHQLHKQFSCSFEFNMAFLIKLAQHSLSCLFGTFLCNTLRERKENSVLERTFSVWPFLSGPMYRNPLYVANRHKVLWPAHNVRDMKLWTEVYLGSLGNQNSADVQPCNGEALGNMGAMVKTRSYGDLITTGNIQNGISRRSSDPNMSVDPNLTPVSNSENNSIADTLSEREDPPDYISNIICDTTRKLQNLTIELQNHDAEDYRNLPKSNEQDINNAANANDVPESAESLERNDTAAVEEELVAEHEKGEQNDYAANTLRLKSCDTPCEEQQQFANDEKHTNPFECQGNATTVTIDTANDINLHLLQSVDLHEHATKATCHKAQMEAMQSAGNEGQQNPWHGSINSSTDTLVPIEPRATEAALLQTNSDSNKKLADYDDIDANYAASDAANAQLAERTNNFETETEYRPRLNSFGRTNQTTSPTSNSSILPQVHMQHHQPPMHYNNNISDSYETNTPSALTTKPALNGFSRAIAAAATTIQLTNKSNNICQSTNPFYTPTTNRNSESSYEDSACSSAVTTPIINPMEESILILPEHQKLEISISGKYNNTVEVNMLQEHVARTREGSSNSGETTVGRYRLDSTDEPHSSSHSEDIAIATTTSTNIAAAMAEAIQTRRRTISSSSNSRRDCANALTKCMSNDNGSGISKCNMPGARSLPLTPPGLPERAQMSIYCPDGLAHALSEQNIRLQQIVHEHKLREDVLLREIHDMRMALLKKTCPNCNNAASAMTTALTNDEQSSTLDNVENVSVCSWEAVEDRSAPPTFMSSSLQQTNAASVLWVPDHAVSRCTSCQTEFWLGRRKHHCRSCGQIFCADCSEFFAPLPDEKLFNPVRLCGPCYHMVTTRMQLPQQQQLQQQTQSVAFNLKANGSSNNQSSSNSSTSGSITHDKSNGSGGSGALTLQTLSALALQQKSTSTKEHLNSDIARAQQHIYTDSAAPAAHDAKCSITVSEAMRLGNFTAAQLKAACCKQAACAAAHAPVPTHCQQDQRAATAATSATAIKATATAASN